MRSRKWKRNKGPPEGSDKKVKKWDIIGELAGWIIITNGEVYLVIPGKDAPTADLTSDDPFDGVTYATKEEAKRDIVKHGGVDAWIEKNMKARSTPTQQKDEPAKNFDAGKLRYDLIPPDALRELAKVYTVGAEKYGERNWEKGMSWGRAFGSLLRHVWDWFGGIEADHEDGLHPLAHAAFRVFQLLAYSMRKVGNDDRPKLRSEATDGTQGAS